MKNDKLGRDEWAEAALGALADHGPAGIAVEPVARALGVTKGSFYWHFETREDLLLAAAERWELTRTEHLAEALGRIADPAERIEALLASAHGHAREKRIAAAIGAMSEHARVGPIVRRVTRRRLELLFECYRALGLSPARAKRRARLAYAMYLGAAELERLGAAPESAAEERACQDEIARMLVPEPEGAAARPKPKKNERAGKARRAESPS